MCKRTICPDLWVRSEKLSLMHKIDVFNSPQAWELTGIFLMGRGYLDSAFFPLDFRCKELDIFTLHFMSKGLTIIPIIIRLNVI